METGAASGDGLAFVSSELGDDDVSGDYTFSCGNGGSVVVRSTDGASTSPDGPFITGMATEGACAVGDATYEGSADMGVPFAVRAPAGRTFERFSIARADGDSLVLDGDYATDFDNVGVFFEEGWSEASLVVAEAGETTRVEGYTSLRRGVAPSVLVEEPPSATADVTFTVVAPWSSNVRSTSSSTSDSSMPTWRRTTGRAVTRRSGAPARSTSPRPTAAGSRSSPETARPGDVLRRHRRRGRRADRARLGGRLPGELPDTVRLPLTDGQAIGQGKGVSVRYGVDAGETTSRVAGYTSLRRTAAPSSSPVLVEAASEHDADVRFSVTAPWSSNETLDVVVDLGFVDADLQPNDGGGPYPAQWRTGTIRSRHRPRRQRAHALARDR